MTRGSARIRVLVVDDQLRTADALARRDAGIELVPVGGEAQERAGPNRHARSWREARPWIAQARMRPDAVVLDLLQRSSRELCERVRTASPETKVILWARDEDAMEVLDPGSTTPRRIFAAVPEELRSELRNVQVNRVEE